MWDGSDASDLRDERSFQSDRVLPHNRSSRAHRRCQGLLTRTRAGSDRRRPPPAARSSSRATDRPPRDLLSRRADGTDYRVGGGCFRADRRRRRCARAWACLGLDDAAASRVLGVASGGLDFYIAALPRVLRGIGIAVRDRRRSRTRCRRGAAARRLARPVAPRRAQNRGAVRTGAQPARGRSLVYSAIGSAARPGQALRHTLLHRAAPDAQTAALNGHRDGRAALGQSGRAIARAGL